MLVYIHEALERAKKAIEEQASAIKETADNPEAAEARDYLEEVARVLRQLETVARVVHERNPGAHLVLTGGPELSRLKKLAGWAEKALDLMEETEEWSGDMLDEMALESRYAGLSTTDFDGMFKRIK